jgi:hypothetical protein
MATMLVVSLSSLVPAERGPGVCVTCLSQGDAHVLVSLTIGGHLGFAEYKMSLAMSTLLLLEVFAPLLTVVYFWL